ncbi:MAG: 30S ribosomal protein S20 [Candidatus Firestonebacteria bacterium]|nr:30S ribosomal protein S20 [Candidatus Firestonebacteria bacterium]
MPTHKSAEKRMRADKKRNLVNSSTKSTLKTLRINVLKSKTKDDAIMNLKKAISSIDKAACKGIIHKNSAARKVSRLTKKVNALTSSTTAQ